MPAFYCDSVSTPHGDFTILFSETGIYEIYFPGSAPQQKCPKKTLPWPRLALDLNRYLEGEEIDWTEYPLDTSGYRPFSAKLLSEVGKIPYGEVRTYRDMAEQAGSPLAWRAAGQALGSNRHPVIIP